GQVNGWEIVFEAVRVGVAHVVAAHRGHAHRDDLLDERVQDARALLAAAAEALALRAHVGARIDGRERDATEALGAIRVARPDALQDRERVLAPVLEARVARRRVTQPGELAQQALQPLDRAGRGLGGAQASCPSSERTLPVREAFLAPRI